MRTIYLTTFTLIVFTSIVRSQWLPRDTKTNACDKLVENVRYSEQQFYSYSNIKACYESTPYNKTKAAQIIEAVKENLKAFYVLLEQSKEDPNPGFDFRLSSTDYHRFSFNQGLSLYSVIKEDGTQQLKVFDDIIDSGTIDCQVTFIDDRPAIDVITEFA
ncbi:13717_t:CDS:2, partial [Cetraspora pellucida]